jgi:hypothetical protein
MANAHTDLSAFFLDNPTALGNEIQHYLLSQSQSPLLNVIDVQLIKFFWPLSSA